MNLAIKKPDGTWWWVLRRDINHPESLVTTPLKSIALWPDDLEYFQKMFPSQQFAVREVLND